MKYNRVIKILVTLALTCSATMSTYNCVNAKENSFDENKNSVEISEEHKDKNGIKDKKTSETSEKDENKNDKKDDKTESKTKDKLEKEKNKEKEKSKKEEFVPINREPLNNEDFMFNGISLGDSIDSLKTIIGKSDSVDKGNLRDKYNWKNFDITVEKEFPYFYINRQDLNLKKVLSGTGISSFYIFGKEAETYRHISVGSSRENVIRAYGKPNEVLWNGKDNSYYFGYANKNKKIYFNISNDEVKNIRVTLVPPAYEKMQENQLRNKIKLEDKDLKIAGFKLGDKFEPHPWQTWEKKRTGVSEEIWYYPGYGVRVTSKSKLINGLFLDDSRMLTSRGLAKGDLKSTLEYIYGEPDKVEINTKGNNPQTAYIYFSPNKLNLMVVYLNKDKINNIVITKNINK